jgi:hypothetical protein
MAKPTTKSGYSNQKTVDCERVLVTLWRGLGPWRESVYLVGGLTPRYLVRDRPPVVPAHAGSMDVDIVIDVQILADTQAYATLEENFQRMGFERAENDKGQKQSWRWRTKTESGDVMVLELLTDAPDIAGGRVRPVPSERAISALNIPHSSMVFDLYQATQITAELLGNNGVTTETVRHANLVSFTCLKAFALNDRLEGKDAHDLIYCIEHASDGMDAAAEQFRAALAGKHGAVIREALAILRNRFASDSNAEGYRKDGPVLVAKFELGDSTEPEERERRAVRQREVSEVIEQLLQRLG